MQNQASNHYLFRMHIPILGEWYRRDYILALIIISVGIILTIFGGLAFTNSEVVKDTIRYPISKVLLFSSLLSSFLAIM